MEAFRYTLAQRHPALFMEMRLGKTLVIIRRVNLTRPLDPEAGLRVLVVAPNSALDSWVDELALEAEQSVVLLRGTRKQRLALLGKRAKWNLINKEGFLSLPDLKSLVNWDWIVCDESTFLKNPQAKVTRYFLSNFRDCPHRAILTGTPNPENDMEFWPQIAFLDGRAFGFKNFWDFRIQCYQPDWSGYGWVPKAGTQDIIKREVGRRCFILRRSDAGVEPTKDRVRRTIDLPPGLRKKYDIAEEEFELEGQETIWAMTRYQWLRQICGGFIDGKLVWDGKIQELQYLLSTDFRNDPVVVWFHYNQEVHAVHDALTKAGITNTYITGEFKPEERTVRKKAWDQGKYQVILLQQAIAQTGMNLSHSDVAVYYSETASSLASRQTQDRILSLDKTGSLLLLYLLVRDSVDTDLHNLVGDKHLRGDLMLSRALAEAMKNRAQTQTNAIR